MTWSMWPTWFWAVLAIGALMPSLWWVSHKPSIVKVATALLVTAATLAGGVLLCILLSPSDFVELGTYGGCWMALSLLTLGLWTVCVPREHLKERNRYTLIIPALVGLLLGLLSPLTGAHAESVVVNEALQSARTSGKTTILVKEVTAFHSEKQLQFLIVGREDSATAYLVSVTPSNMARLTELTRQTPSRFGLSRTLLLTLEPTVDAPITWAGMRVIIARIVVR